MSMVVIGLRERTPNEPDGQTGAPLPHLPRVNVDYLLCREIVDRRILRRDHEDESNARQLDFLAAQSALRLVQAFAAKPDECAAFIAAL